MNIQTQQYLQQFFEKDAETIKTWFEAACKAHPNPPFGYEGLKDNPRLHRCPTDARST